MQACRSFKRIVSRMKQGTHRTSDRVLLFVVGVIVVSLLIPRWLNMAEEGYDGPLSSEVVSSLGNMGIVPDTKAMAAVEREYLAIMSRPRTESDEISLTSKQHRHTRVCRIEWMSSSNYGTMVEIDIETGYLVHYVETKAHSACVFEHSPMLCDAAAFTEAISFVEEHAYLPEDAVLSRVESNQFGKLVEWKHVVHSVPVKDDHIRVQMNDLSGAITSFSFIWNEVRESKKTGISAMQAIQEVYSNNLIRTGTQNVESARLEWIPEERGKGHYLLAWRIESDVASLGSMPKRAS